jgi:hypothetical protein
MIQVIALSGKAGCGKDYITSNIITKHYGYVPFSLAWHIKTGLIGKNVLTYEELFINKPPHARHLIQQEGTENGRDIYGQNMWLDTAFAWMRLIHEQWGIVRFIIPDVRFPNEVEYIQRKGGKVIRVLASQRVASSSLSLEARLHRSETALDDYPLDNFDGLLDNDIGSEDTLADRVYHIFKTLNIV